MITSQINSIAKYPLKMIIIWLLIPLSAACTLSTISQGNPSPDIYPQRLEGEGFYIFSNDRDSEDLCVGFLPESFWEPGDNADELDQHLLSSFQIRVDDRLINVRTVVSLDGPLVTRYDNEGNILGTYGGGMSACFFISDLTEGIHTITLEASTTSSNRHSQTWQFEVHAEGPPTFITPRITDEP